MRNLIGKCVIDTHYLCRHNSLGDLYTNINSQYKQILKWQFVQWFPSRRYLPQNDNLIFKSIGWIKNKKNDNVLKKIKVRILFLTKKNNTLFFF